MEPNLSDDPRITAVGLFVEAYSGLTARFAVHYEQHGTSAVEFEVLMRLARSPGHWLRMSDLAAQTSLSTSGVTRVVDRMERDGLVARQACPHDRRSSHAVLTAAGLDRIQRILPGHLELVERWLTGPLTPAQLDALLTGLRIIRDAVNPGATAGTTEPAGVVPQAEPAGVVPRT